AVVMSLTIFTGCIQVILPTNVLSIEKTGSDGYVDTYTITYTDGRTSTFTITNGRDGINGEDGDDSPTITIDELYNRYRLENPTATYEEFLKEFLKVEVDINSVTINKLLSSSVKIYSEFTMTKEDETNSLSVGAGSGVIYRITDNYTYLITNFHVIYEKGQNTPSKIARKIVCYLYGSELNPIKKGEDQDGYAIYDYGSNAIECTFIGGSIAKDIAVLRVDTNVIKGVNENISAVEFAESYHVGETAIAIGNAKDDGISVTKGIVSVDCERVKLQIDDTIRVYDLLRMDTPLYQGNSGGGLFNVEGKLIGITNAGDTQNQNVNFAVPLDTVKNSVENILHYNNGYINKIVFGIDVVVNDSKYVYNKVTGYGQIVEELKITVVHENYPASTLGLQVDDIITTLNVNGTPFEIYRDFNLSDKILTLRAGDVVSITYKRNDTTYTTNDYTIKATDIIRSE
ncbi:MAG: serine protease, partial [Clostridia bacterium]|nr:serine protease [Clostridia bacterium]